MKYILKKSFTLIITLLLVSMVTFGAFSIIPGNIAITRLGQNATPERIAALEAELGLDRPVAERYVDWLLNAIRGDFGESYQYSGVPVSDLLLERLPVTAILTAMSLILILVISIPLGLLAARKEGSVIDTAVNLLTQVTMAIPAFFLGMLITFVFGLVLKWFQPGKFVMPQEDLAGCVIYLIFPAIAIALPKIAMVVKFLRNSVLSEVGKDYVWTARSKGNREGRVLVSHVLRNAMIPVITFIAIVVAEIIANSIVVEQVFSVNGVGRLLVTAISNRDYPIVQAVVMYITAAVVLINFIIDILYQVVDPRVRTE
ncbi:MAG TPA: ABC transporter permease [Candidatus Onthocola gallistercoris]|uniref:ABC transporter permease n=1 Tax=Candidatus Onthocola gallistercoris TaxID=2840876 RepID=A0A9D1KY00_9FIRM|nr:ABC transporter permease [Candidatus Onthocola gallistercoris]